MAENGGLIGAIFRSITGEIRAFKLPGKQGRTEIGQFSTKNNTGVFLCLKVVMVHWLWHVISCMVKACRKKTSQILGQLEVYRGADATGKALVTLHGASERCPRHVGGESQDFLKSTHQVIDMYKQRLNCTQKYHKQLSVRLVAFKIAINYKSFTEVHVNLSIQTSIRSWLWNSPCRDTLYA